MKAVKTRFCPSPTGLMHLGNTRTALFNALFAYHQNGVFLLRIEDTDVTRSDVKFTQAIQDDLHWLGLEWQEGIGQDGADDGPYEQSKRQTIYDKFYKTLEAKGLAYPCFCSESQLALSRKLQRAAGKPPRYAGTCRSLSATEVAAKFAAGEKATLRFRMPQNEIIAFKDLVKGPQRFNSDDIGDFIIRRTDGTSPFMYCNAIDDALMGVNYALRGDDHLTNTPRQIMILQALELPVPHYGHISLIIGHDNSPLSKRNGSRSTQDLRDAGYLPLAINNYLARLGHYYENTELMPMQQLAREFDLANLSTSPAKFDADQLKHWQKLAVVQLTEQQLWGWMRAKVASHVPTDKQSLFVETIKFNIIFPDDALMWAKKLFASNLEFEAEHQLLLAKTGAEFFVMAEQFVREQGSDFKALSVHLKQKLNVKGKALFQPLRIALTANLHGPEMANICNLLGQTAICHRFKTVIKNLG